MATLLTERKAPGAPGLAPCWSRGDKEGVGAAYSALSRVWFTLARGAVEEVYYPTVDRPQVRGLQLLVSDGHSFCHQEGADLETSAEYLPAAALGFRITNADPAGRYHLVKEIIADPHLPCLLQQVHVNAPDDLRQCLRLFAVLSPRLGGQGWGNSGNVTQTASGHILTAHRDGNWLALGATVPFRRLSCGYAGTSDGLSQLRTQFDWEEDYDCAKDGHIRLIAEIDQADRGPFVLGLAFGESLHQALTVLSQSLATPFSDQRERFVAQWQRGTGHGLAGRERVTGDGGRLYRVSHNLLMAHEDKLHSGALIASLSIPWGESKGDDDLGGYHLVWTRDLCQCASALLSVGHDEIPFRALVYLSCTQREDGGFYQNFWVNGEPYWRGIQLDEVAFPILLAWQLREANALRDFDPWPMIRKAAAYLVEHGPATPQDRWEECSGYSPSTLAAHIAGLIVAAVFARDRGEIPTAQYLEEYADFLEARVEDWTVTNNGLLLPDIRRHYIRIHPVTIDDPHADEDPNHGLLTLPNQPPGAPSEFPAIRIIDAGFLELVRYGVRSAGDSLIEDSLRVVDATLKTVTPFGPCWRRYNHDGYGQHDDGGPYQGWGRGRAWPLLTGERGHYELAAGRDVGPFLRALEGLASPAGLLPEQVWDDSNHSERLGRPTGGARPLAWAHAEYLKLVRSVVDGQVFDQIQPVFERYRTRNRGKPMEIWKFNRQPRRLAAGSRLRIQAAAAFRLRWTADCWQTITDSVSTPTGLGSEYVDIAVRPGQRAPIQFTFFWTQAEHWEGRDFRVEVDGRCQQESQ